MKRFLALLLSLLYCGALIACGPTNSPNGTPSAQDTLDNTTSITAENDENTEEDTKEEEMKITDLSYALKDMTQSLKLHGRAAAQADGIACDHTASGIEFSAYVEGPVTLTLTTSAEAYFTLYVDGVRSDERIKAGAGTSTLTLADFATGGVHTVRLLKQTEARLSLCVLSTLQFKGYLNDAPAQKQHYVVFIGDSITCGFGNLCANGTENGGSAIYQDGTNTYAYLTAQKLDADLEAVSCSGIGITKGSDSIPFPAGELFSKQSKFRSDTQAFTPTRVPDLVVINLGTNDAANGASVSQFMKDVKALIELVRSTYGKDVPIVWAYNMMNDSLYGSAKFAISGLGGENAGIYACQLNQNHDGGVGHPSLAAHAEAAELLAQFIRQKISSTEFHT